MKRIILLRHAKSSWQDADLADHDRPLNKRGRAAAPVMGQWLRQQSHVPDIILCSTSARTRETLNRMHLPVEQSQIRFLEDLYLAPSDDLLSALRLVEDLHQATMIIAHEPGLSSLSQKLARRVAANCSDAFDHFPTAAAAVFEAGLKRWDMLTYGSSDFTEFVKPRDLME